MRLLGQMDDTLATRMREALEETARQSLRAGEIIRHLREFVTRGETEKTSQDIRKLVEESGALALMGSRERGIRSVFDFAPGAELVTADGADPQGADHPMRNAMEAMRDSERARTGLCAPPPRQGRCWWKCPTPGGAFRARSRRGCSSLRDSMRRMGLGCPSKRILVAHGGDLTPTECDAAEFASPAAALPNEAEEVTHADR